MWICKSRKSFRNKFCHLKKICEVHPNPNTQWYACKKKFEELCRSLQALNLKWGHFDFTWQMEKTAKYVTLSMYSLYLPYLNTYLYHTQILRQKLKLHTFLYHIVSNFFGPGNIFEFFGFIFIFAPQLRPATRDNIYILMCMN